MKSIRNTFVLLIAAAATVVNLSAADDLTVADFEAQDYGAWTTIGDAFGPAPARGTLPGQMPVDGFKGKGLVNSFFKGDDSTGTLTSPEFSDRKALHQFPHRRRKERGEDLHQPAHRREGGAQRDRSE